MQLALFEDNFDTLNPNWIPVGTHQKFTVKAEDGFLKFLFDWLIPPETPHYAITWAGVYYSEPFDLRNKSITIKLDMYPKSQTDFFQGMLVYSSGLMIANKKLPVGIDLTDDPELMAVYCRLRYTSYMPADVTGHLIKGYNDIGPFGRGVIKYPPTEIRADISGNTVSFYEADAPVCQLNLPFDPSHAYIYLLARGIMERSDGKTLIGRGPELVLFDYIKIDKIPPSPLTAFIGQTTAVTFATLLLMMDASLIIRGLRLIR